MSNFFEFLFILKFVTKKLHAQCACRLENLLAQRKKCMHLCKCACVKSSTGHYYHCHQEIIRITSLHLGGNRPTCTTYLTLNCDIPHNSYPYIAWVNEASEIKYLAKGHKHVGTYGARTHNLPFMSPALFR